jgi:hypothetical protein
LACHITGILRQAKEIATPTPDSTLPGRLGRCAHTAAGQASWGRNPSPPALPGYGAGATYSVMPGGPRPSRGGCGSTRSHARAARRRCARPGQTAGADGEIVRSVAERHVPGAPADRASPPWAPALGRAGRCLSTGEAASLSLRGHQGLLLGAVRGADHLSALLDMAFLRAGFRGQGVWVGQGMSVATAAV